MLTIKDIVTDQQTRTARNSHTLKAKDHIVVSTSSPSSVPPWVPGSMNKSGHTKQHYFQCKKSQESVAYS